MLASLYSEKVKIFSVLDDATSTKATVKIKFDTGETLTVLDITNIKSWTGNWLTLALEVESKDVNVIFKEWGGTHEKFSSNSNFLTSEFSIGTAAQTLILSKATSGTDEEDATGVILSWFHTCNPLGNPDNQSIDSLIAFMELPTARGFWLPDDTDSFINYGNQLNELGMQPELFSGDTRAEETSISPLYNVDSEKKRQTSQGRYFSLNMIKYMNY